MKTKTASFSLQKLLVAVALILLFFCTKVASHTQPIAGWNNSSAATFDYWSNYFSLPPMNTTGININNTLPTTDEQSTTIPLSISADIYGLNLSGSIQFTGDLSLVRILMIDNNNNEHLIYEVYPLNVTTNSFQMNNVCEETCFLNNTKATALKVELINASVYIDKINVLYSTAPLASDIATTQATIKSNQNTIKINAINRKIQEQGLKWVAGETSVSQLTHSEKHKLLGLPGNNIINLQGFEYYKSGIFELLTDQPPASTNDSLYIDKFDWRSRHGANNPNSPYYDGDANGSGWITSVKNQGSCGSCWAFAVTGATEALVNLYYNQHLDPDLAEQDALSCSGAGSCFGGFPSTTLDYYTTTGVVDEGCFPYSATDETCSNKCTSPANLVHISGKLNPFSHPIDEDQLKSAIIEYGPLSGGIRSWRHAMTLVGYDKDPEDGKTVWIFKNSWGSAWGENGYGNIKVPIADFGWTWALLNPPTSTQAHEIICVDHDADGYFNWGLSATKPASCPIGSRPEKDCDDSNPMFGPYDTDGSCLTHLRPSPSVAYDTLNGRYLVVFTHLKNIYGKFVTQNGTPDGSDFIISDDTDEQSNPTVIYDSLNNRFLALWTDMRNRSTTSADIYGRIINADGSFYSDDIAVSRGHSLQDQAAVAYDTSNQIFLITWQDFRNLEVSNYDIYAQKVDAEGSRIGNNFVISIDKDNPDENASNNQIQPAVAFSSVNSKFLVVWSDKRKYPSEGREIYGQIVSSLGSIGSNFQISEVTDKNKLQPTLAFDSSNNHFLVAWSDSRNKDTTKADIYGQLVNDTGILTGNNFIITNSLENQLFPAIVYDPTNNRFLLIWEDHRNIDIGQTGYQIINNSDIYAQFVEVVSDSFNPIGSNFVVSNLLGGQQIPKLAVNNDSNNFLVAFSSFEDGAQAFRTMGEVDLVLVEQEGSIKGDLDNNRKIDTADYQLFRNTFGTCVGDTDYLSKADFDSDGCIGNSDFKIWYTQYKAYQSL